jgi:hypothetical protein
MGAMDGEKVVVFRVREFDMERDLAAAEELECQCQVGLCGDDAAADGDGGKRKTKKRGMSLSVELVGDPLARVRHAPEHVMLVTERTTDIIFILDNLIVSYCSMQTATY